METERPHAPQTAGCAPPRTIPNLRAGENGKNTDPADDYRKFLVEHWAAAFVDGPMKTIEQYEKTAKLLVTVVTPLQAVLFAAYGLLAPRFLAASPGPEAPPDWFSTLLLILFVASVAGVFVCVVYVCSERPKLIIGKGDSERRLLSSVLADRAALPEAVKAWESDIERVVECKHWWLTAGFCCFFAGSVVAVAVLIFLAFGLPGMACLAGATALGALMPRLVRYAVSLKRKRR